MNSPDNKQKTQDNVGEKKKSNQDTTVDDETQTDLNNNVARSSIESLLGFVTPKEDTIPIHAKEDKVEAKQDSTIVGIGEAPIIIGGRKESTINGNTSYIAFTPQPNTQGSQNVLHYYAPSHEPSQSHTMTPIRSICNVISPLSSHIPAPTSQHVSPRLHTTEQNLITDMNVIQQAQPIIQQQLSVPVQTNSHSLPTLHYPITNQPIKTQAVSEEERHRRRLERNRIAARQCRERKKAYVTNLETRVTRLEEENSRLRQQLGNLQTKLSYCPAEVQETLRLYCLVEDLKERLSNGQTIKTDPKI
ncbi:16972_t:CDS:2, partial [Racocetra fulgida]